GLVERFERLGGDGILHVESAASRSSQRREMAATPERVAETLRERAHVGPLAAFDVDDGVGRLPFDEAQRVNGDRTRRARNVDAGAHPGVMRTPGVLQRRMLRRN